MLPNFLISVPADSKVERLKLTAGGTVSYYPDFLTPDEHLKLLQHLVYDVDWQTSVNEMYGKMVTFPRLLAAMFDPGFKVTKTGSLWEEDDEWVAESGTWTPQILSLKQRIEKLINRKIGYAQLGYYKTGDNYLGYHADNELYDNDIIASVSFGVTRRFVIRERYLPEGKTRKSGPPNYEFFLKGGSLFLFDHLAAKTCYKHSVPKYRKMDNYVDPYGLGRVNITFRER